MRAHIAVDLHRRAFGPRQIDLGDVAHFDIALPRDRPVTTPAM